MPKKRRKRDQKMEEIPMTPMIDIVFQLLVYFVFTYKIVDVDTHMQVSRPAPSKTPPKEEVEMHKIAIMPPEMGAIYNMNGAPMDIEQLEVVLETIASADSSQTITVQATATSLHEDLVRMLNLCAKYDLINIAIVSM